MHPKIAIVGSGVLALGQLAAQVAPASNDHMMGVIGVVNAVLSLSLFIAAVGFAFGYGKLHQRNDDFKVAIDEIKASIKTLDDKLEVSHNKLREDIVRIMLGPRLVDKRREGGE